jgi:hypothetical protein
VQAVVIVLGLWLSKVTPQTQRISDDAVSVASFSLRAWTA